MNLINKIKTFDTPEQFKDELGGKLFSVEFIKKDGTLRKMTARLGVTKHLKGVGMRYDAISKGLLPVYDMQKQSYRTINLDTILKLKVKGVTHE